VALDSCQKKQGFEGSLIEEAQHQPIERPPN